MPREHQRYVWLALALAIAPLAMTPLGGARAATYEFLAAPQTDLNRVFRLDKVTGEVGLPIWPQGRLPFGVTLCYPPARAPRPARPANTS